MGERPVFGVRLPYNPLAKQDLGICPSIHSLSITKSIQADIGREAGYTQERLHMCCRQLEVLLFVCGFKQLANLVWH